MNIHAAALAVLLERDVDAKCAGAAKLQADWLAGAMKIEPFEAPQTLADAGRPDRPELAAPSAMPRRQPSSPEGHAALIHSLAHIEFNAINLALDAVYRFRDLPADYYGDWLKVAAEEAEHFNLLRDHLRHLGFDYGDFQAHAGLWDMARKTADDLLRRMALVPRLMEARGLDVTPGIQHKLRSAGDKAGAAILDVILRDEIGHVAAGDRWFRHVCVERGLDPEATFRAQLLAAGVPLPKRPMNESARLQAGFSQSELEALNASA